MDKDVKEERKNQRKSEDKKKRIKIAIYIAAFLIALCVGSILTMNAIHNTQVINNQNEQPDPTTETTIDIGDYVPEIMNNGQIIVYHPRTDIEIQRISSLLPAPAISTIKNDLLQLEQSFPEEELHAVTNMTVYGESFACQLPSSSLDEDTFNFIPKGKQNDNTMYSLYGDMLAIEFQAGNLENLSMSLSNFVQRFNMQEGNFQTTIKDAKENARMSIVISGTVNEPGLIIIRSSDKSIDSFIITSTVNIYNLKLTIKIKGRQDKVIAIEDGNYGAMFDALTTWDPQGTAKQSPFNIDMY